MMQDPQNPPSVLAEMQAEVVAVASDPALRQESNFLARARAIESLEFNTLGAAGQLARDLEAVNQRMFQGLREKIRMVADFREMLLKHAGRQSAGRDGPGYDDLDVFLNGLFSRGSIPDESQISDPGMVYYQKTPGRIVLELVDRVGFTAEDVFYDLGSGLGQVPLLVHLLSGVTAKGVEFEPAYVRYSERIAADLRIPGVTFVNADVRTADLSDGTVFFLYTPFTGKMLEEVLEKLRTLSERKPIRIFTYGPCTLEISVMRGWVPENPEPPDAFKLRSFRSGARQGTR